MTEIQLMKYLESHPYFFRDEIKIKSPYLTTPQSFRGYYLNHTHNSYNEPYFYGDDKIGMGLRLHYRAIQVNDYLLRSRQLIKKNSEVDWECRVTADSRVINYNVFGHPESFIMMTINPNECLPGDIFEEDPEGSPLRLVLNISQTEKGIHLLALELGIEEIDVWTYETMEELEGRIFALVPHKSR